MLAQSDVLVRHITAPTGKRVITVFGCGGDRDRSKRPKMGQAAAREAIFVVATSDNPRSEEPLAIFGRDRARPQSQRSPHTVEPDRAKAIRLALASCQGGDVVADRRKGHEKVQILATRTIPFDDAEIALSLLGELGYGGVQ